MQIIPRPQSDQVDGFLGGPTAKTLRGIDVNYLVQSMPRAPPKGARRDCFRTLASLARFREAYLNAKHVACGNLPSH